MHLLLDITYLFAVIITLPVWLIRMILTGKINTDWAGRFGKVTACPPMDERPVILIHAVSVGEVNSIRIMVECLADSEKKPHIIIAATTDTGFVRAQALFGKSHNVVRYPFDISLAVKRFLNRVKPNMVVLVELEVWPNFTAICKARSIPVCVVNGRLSERSLKRYGLIKSLVKPMFERLQFVAAQNPTYAERFIKLGMQNSRVSVTNTMKWDTAEISDWVSLADELAESLGIDRSKPLVVAGSTSPLEHDLLHRTIPKGVQLLCAPRKPEWFDAAALSLPGCVRRSKGNSNSHRDRYLLDTIGELRAAYSLADLVIVGRTFSDLHGSDMMEPISLGKATIVGPDVLNFQDTADDLLKGNGMVQTTSDKLQETIQMLLNDKDHCKELAENGRNIIRNNQGASKQHADMILSLSI